MNKYHACIDNETESEFKVFNIKIEFKLIPDLELNLVNILNF